MGSKKSPTSDVSWAGCEYNTMHSTNGKMFFLPPYTKHKPHEKITHSSPKKITGTENGNPPFIVGVVTLEKAVEPAYLAGTNTTVGHGSIESMVIALRERTGDPCPGVAGCASDGAEACTGENNET